MSETLVKKLDDLYGLDKNGKTRIWQASIFKADDGKGVSYISHGQLNGKLQTERREFLSGKNIGKINETTPVIQCESETTKKWLNKKEKEQYTTNNPDDNYQCTLECNTAYQQEIKGKIFPMLAQSYERASSKKKKNDIIFPCYAQPKLDGVRDIVYLNDGEIKHQSRTGSYFQHLQHISGELQGLFIKYPNIALDGELYTNEMPFEELVGLVKKKELSDEDDIKIKLIKYHIYDIIDNSNPDMIYAQRHGWIIKEINKLKSLKYLEIVQTELINNCEDDFKALFNEFITNGYEGIMLRNIDGKYMQNFRSHDLKKYKEFFEDEYPIVGFEEGQGRDKGTVIWICTNNQGNEFNVRPMGSLAFRKDLFINASTYINKHITVKYQELSEKGIPRFPVGKAIRDGY